MTTSPSPIAIPLVDGDTLMVDNSSVEPFTTCPRQAEYAIAKRLRAVGDRPALRFGGIAHKVLEMRYRSGEVMLAQTDAVTKKMVEVARREYQGVPGPLDELTGEPLSWVKPPYIPPFDDFRTFDTMVSLIQKYGETYPFESFELLTLPTGQPFVELPFALPLGEIRVDRTLLVQNMIRTPDGGLARMGEPVSRHLSVVKIVWIGRIDLVYTYNGGIYIMDHKTSTMATNMAEFEISHQFYGYRWAVETLLEQPVSGVTINRMVCRKPTKTGIPFTFERKLISFQDGLSKEWATDILHILSGFINYAAIGYFPKHTAWCVGKFGTCQFHKVCSLDPTLPGQRDVMLASGEFEENTWSPLKDQGD